MKNLITLAALILGIISSTNTGAQSFNSNKVNASIEKADGVILISWDLEKEVNTRYYIVEKSIDGVHYKMLSSVTAHGSSVFPSHYEITDNENNDGVATYKLTLVSMDGSPALASKLAYNKSLENTIADVTKQK